MHAVANWFEEIDTPAAKDFKKRWRAKFPNETYINDMGYNAYVALYMYKMLVENGEVDREGRALRKVIATGKACIDAPEGKICIDPKSQHTSHQMRLIGVNADHSVRGDQGLRRDQALLAGRGRLRPDQGRSEGAVRAERTCRRRSDAQTRSCRRACGGLSAMRLVLAMIRAMFAEVFSIAFQFADVFAFLILAAGRARHHFRDDGHHQHGARRVHHLRDLRDGDRRAARRAAAAGPGARRAGRGPGRHRAGAHHHPPALHRPLDSILATWGISLIVTQGMLVVLGSSWPGIGTPLGSFPVGHYTFSTYRLVLFGAAVGVMVGIYLLFMRTGFGMLARATMQNAAMARALGVRTRASTRSASASARRSPDSAARCTRRP